jgi:PAS domain S-box-containing protein
MTHVMMVDDDPMILELGGIFLEKLGDIQIDGLQSATKALEKLQTTHYDAIVSDYEMPVMDGITFLKKVRAKDSDIPFIIFTGKGREDVVIDALNNGADYYLQKEGDADVLFTELSHHVLQGVKRKRAEEEVKRQRDLFHQIMSNMGQGLLMTGNHWRFEYVNSAFARMVGRPPKELIGCRLENFIHPGDLPILDKARASRLAGQETSYDVQLIGSNGKRIYAHISGVPRWHENKVVGSIEVITDMTETFRAQEHIRNSERRLADIIDFLPDATFVIGKDGCVIAWNRAIEEMTGISKGDIIGKGDHAYAVPFYGGNRPILVDLIFSSDEELESRYDFIKKEGKTIFGEAFTPSLYEGKGAHLWGTASPLFDDEGNIVGAIESIRDISKVKQVEEELRQSGEMYRTIFETTGTTMVIVEEDGTIYLANTEAERLFGYSVSEIEGKKKWTEFVAEDDLAKMKEYHSLRRIDPGSAPRNYEFKFVDRYGDVKDIFLTIAMLPGTKMSVVSLMNITELKRMEDELRKSEEMYRTIFETTGSGMVIIEEDTTISLANAEFAELVGYSKNEIEGKKSWTEFVVEDDQERMKEYHRLRRIDPACAPERYEFNLVDRHGNIRNEILTVAMIPGTKRSVVAFADITEHRHVENELRKYQDHLEQLVEERTIELEAKNAEMERFVYAVSHDLMTPLVTISGSMGFLKKDIESGNPEQIEADLRTITDVTVNMSELLDDTLELSRIGRVANPPDDIPFGDIVQEALNLSEEMIRLRGVKVSVSDDLPVVHVDRQRLVEVLVNLIENSIKYMGKEAQPRIYLGYRKDENETVFFVRDNGIGIDPSQHDKVFELFYRLDADIKGTGAGLTIVKRIIDAHGGRIWIESETGQGCTVCFTLPLGS